MTNEKSVSFEQAQSTWWRKLQII